MRPNYLLHFMAALSLGLGASLGLDSCSPSGPRTVDYPVVNLSNTSTIDISKVELNDSSTVVHFKAHFRPHYWIRVAGDSYLMADGKKYSLTGAEVIEPDSLFWMPDSGEADFALLFQPLPFSTKKFDFIEGDGDRAFQLLGVDLSGSPLPELPDGLPADLRRAPVAQSVPEPAFEIGETTVNFHLVPFREGLIEEPTLYVNTLVGPQDEYRLKFDNEGNASVTFTQYGPVRTFLVANQSSLAEVTPEPGEIVDCYINMAQTGLLAMKHRPDSIRPHIVRFVTNGKNRDFERMSQELSGDYSINIYDGSVVDYRMSTQEYKDALKSTYDTMRDSIATSDLSPMEKEFQLLRLQNTVIAAMGRGYYSNLANSYRYAKNDWRSPVPADSVKPRLTPEDMAEVAGWFEIQNPKLLMDNKSLASLALPNDNLLTGLPEELGLYIRMADKSIRRELTSADLDTLKTLSNPFFAAACDSIARKAEREYRTLSKQAVVTPTPNVADDKLFDAIIAPHKGKVVVVDLWNTWCGPCRNALAKNEPLKQGELSDEDIVWIYIADDSSDTNKYLKQITQIRGLHYKVSAKQIAALREKFDVDGIPYYILVDRDGKAQGRPDLRDHDKYVMEIKSKL